MRQGNWNQINTSPPPHPHPLRETAFYAFLLNKRFVNVSLISARRGKKNIELRELTKNRVVCFFYFQHFFQPCVFQPLPSASPPPRPFQKVLGGRTCLCPVLQPCWTHSLPSSHIFITAQPSKGFLKEFRGSRAGSGGGMGWAAGSWPTPAGSVPGFGTGIK